MFRISRLFLFTFFLAVLVRVLLVLWAVTYPLDINGDQFRFEDWVQAAHIHGLGKTYENAYVHTIPHVITVPNNQPPGTIYVLSTAYEVYIGMGKVMSKLTHTPNGSIHWVNTYLFHSMLRVPSMLADLFLGVLLYLLVVKEKGDKRGVLAASLVWFHPVILFNSTIWGQTDAITSLFFFLALFLAFKKQYVLSLLAFAASVYIKLSLLPLLPFYLLFLYFHSGKQWQKLAGGMVLSLLVILIATVPISSQPVSWFLSHWQMFAKGEAQNITIVAFNFWWMVTCLPVSCPNTLQSYDHFLFLPMSFWAYSLFTLTILPLLFLQLKKSKLFIEKTYLFHFLALIALLVFLFLPRMHDRYLYPFFPLLAGAIGLSIKPKKLLVFFGVLSLLHFANLLSSWYPTRYPSEMYAQLNYNLWYRWSISVLTVFTALLFYQESVRVWWRKKPELRVKKKKV